MENDLRLLGNLITDYVNSLKEQGHETAATIVASSANASLRNIRASSETKVPDNDDPQG